MFRAGMAVVWVVTLSVAGCAASGTAADSSARSKRELGGLTPHETVVATEKAFARTMAERDFQAFRSFLSDEAIFMTGSRPLRGKQRVADVWKQYFEAPEAPFSWEPERVVVIDAEGLAFSTGPVFAPDGTRIGVYSSVWRREADGVWRIIFDKGGCACD